MKLSITHFATTAAADPYCTAVAPAEHPAAFAPFQRFKANFPPAQNDDSALSPALPAVQFSGYIAKFTFFAARSVDFEHYRRNI